LRLVVVKVKRERSEKEGGKEWESGESE